MYRRREMVWWRSLSTSKPGISITTNSRECADMSNQVFSSPKVHTCKFLMINLFPKVYLKKHFSWNSVFMFYNANHFAHGNLHSLFWFESVSQPRFLQLHLNGPRARAWSIAFSALVTRLFSVRTHINIHTDIQQIFVWVNNLMPRVRTNCCCRNVESPQLVVNAYAPTLNNLRCVAGVRHKRGDKSLRND